MPPHQPEDCISDFIRDLVGDDQIRREGLQETPVRYHRAMQFLTSGYHTDPTEFMKTFEDGSEGYRGLVFQGQIELNSLCEHHMLPFFGVAHVGYIPTDRIIGLSKIARLVDMYSRRLQVQERLTRQIAEELDRHLSPRAVGVVIRCRHMCMEMRGVQKRGTVTYTSHLMGDFMEDPSSRAEFMQFVSLADQGLRI